MMETKDKPKTKEQRKILRLNRDNPDWTPKDIAEEMDVGWIKPQYCKRIIEDMQLPEEKRTIRNMATVTTTETDETDQEPEQEADEAPSIEDNEPVHYTSRPFSSLGSKSQTILNHIEENPDDGLEEIRDAVDASGKYVKDIIIRQSEFIDDDAAVWDDLDNPRKVHDVAELDADVPTEVIETIQNNPQESRRWVSNQVGVSENHVGHIMSAYEHLLPEAWCERFPSLSDGGKLPYNDGDMAAQCGAKGAEAKGSEVSTSINPGVADEAEEAEAPLTASEQTESEMNETMDSLFDDDGFLQTAKVQQQDTEITVDEAEEAEEAEEVDEEDGAEPAIQTIDLTDMPGGVVVEDSDVERLRQEAESLPDHLSAEMEGYKAGIERALEALGLDD